MFTARPCAQQAVADSAGIPQGVADQMLIAPYNDLAAVEALLNEHKDVAAIIAEPLQRIISAEPGYLQGLGDLCDKHHVLLIFDEIVTGFRLAYGGGFPLAALGASAEIMQHFDNAIVGADKWLMQLGTLSGNPVAAAAGLKTLEVLRRKGSYDTLRAIGKSLQDMQSDALTKGGFSKKTCGPTLGCYGSPTLVTSESRQVSARGKSCNFNSFPDSVFNAPERPEYQIALEALRPVLYNLPPKVIAIDGYCGAGKTTLGRFLAWRFNISLL